MTAPVPQLQLLIDENINCPQYTDIHFVKLKNSKISICPKTSNADCVFHRQAQWLHCFKGKGLQMDIDHFYGVCLLLTGI